MRVYWGGSPEVGAASVCLLSMMFLLGASRLGSLTSLYLRFTFLFHLTSGVTGSAALKHGFLSYRLLRMNVQGCHNILAICSHIEFEKMTASGPVHHPLKIYTVISPPEEIAFINFLRNCYAFSKFTKEFRHQTVFFCSIQGFFFHFYPGVTCPKNRRLRRAFEGKQTEKTMSQI